jgi:hypothetical protein
MKRWLAVLLVALFFSGCGAAARESEYYKHGTLYKSWDHLKFSTCGYWKPTAKDVQKSREQEWWGKTVEVPR